MPQSTQQNIRVPDMRILASIRWSGLPANSPDLNPIENVWLLLKYRIGRRFPRTIDELRQYVIEEWDKLEPQDYLKYIEEMPERYEAVIAAGGGHTKW